MNTIWATHRSFTISTLIITVLLLAAPAIGSERNEPHQRAACAACHAGGQSAAENASLIVKQCASCHQAAALQALNGAMHASQGNRCLDCHSFHEPSRLIMAVGRGQRLAKTAIQSANCRSCHDSRGNLANLSAAHRKAAALYHSEAESLQLADPSRTCLRCHSGNSDSAWQDQTDGVVIAFSEHASHPFGVPVVPGSGNSSNWIAREIDPEVYLVEGRIECQTCHLLTAATPALTVPISSEGGLCKACHRQFGDERRDPRLVLALTGPQ